MNMIARLGFAAATVVTLAFPAIAQTQEGLVNVNLGDVVLKEIASDIDVDVSQIPVTVQVPVGVAANVCGVDANVLASQKKDGAVNCDAKSSSQALTQVVQKQLKKS
ncbi:MAG: hypothetical protein H0T56_00805 [Pseudaminobacter sp.]|nr:hypothetical protein [Pseudaminobacter sp.]